MLKFFLLLPESLSKIALDKVSLPSKSQRVIQSSEFGESLNTSFIDSVTQSGKLRNSANFELFPSTER